MFQSMPFDIMITKRDIIINNSGIRIFFGLLFFYNLLKLREFKRRLKYNN